MGKPNLNLGSTKIRMKYRFFSKNYTGTFTIGKMFQNKEFKCYYDRHCDTVILF